MNTMNMPGFTAEASVYKTSGHYQTGRHAIDLPTHLIGTIHPAAINVPGEVIVIVEQWPPDPWTPPLFGGHGVSPPPTFEGGGGGGGGGGVGGGQPSRPSRPKRPTRRPIETLGEGPNYSQIRNVLTCVNAGVGAQECHSCNDNVCACYYCETHTGQCTVFYDCTATYGETG